MNTIKRVLNWTLVKFVLEVLLFIAFMTAIRESYSFIAGRDVGLSGPNTEFGPMGDAIGGVLSMIVSYCLAVGIVERRMIGELSLKNLPKDGLIGSGIAFLAVSLLIGIMFIADAYNVSGINEEFAVFFILAWIFLFALQEEIMFRGFLYRIFENRFGTLFALIISSLPFGFAHLGNDHASLVSTSAVVLAGLWLGILFTWSEGRLWVPIFGHVAWNFGQVFYGVPVSGFDVFGRLVESEISGPVWLTGGGFGPEASYFAVGLLAILFIGFYRNTIKRGLIVPFKLKGDPWVANQVEDATETA